MKGLNFWQWLGIGLLVLGLILFLRRPTSRDADRDATGTPSNTTPAHITPTTTSATQPQ